MSALLMGRAFYVELPSRPKLVLLALADHANDDGSGIHVGQVRIAQKVGLGERQVRRYLDQLRQLGFIERLQHGGSNRWTGQTFPDSYRLNVDQLPDVPRAITPDTNVRSLRVTPDTSVRSDNITPVIQGHNTGHPGSVTPDIAMSAKPSEEPSEEPPEGTRAVKAFVDHYHRLCPMLPRCLALTPKRRRQIAARLRERSLEEWESILRALAASKFHTGENDRAWRADIDWLTRNTENGLKLLERGSVPERTRPRALAAGGVRMLTYEESLARRRAEGRA